MLSHINLPRVKSAELIRRFFVSWLLAVTIEFLLLPEDLRPLADLNGLAQMSMLRILCITCTGMLLLWVLSCFIETGVERWSMVAIFAVLAAVTVASSFTWSFFALCILIALALVVYAAYGWNGSPEPVAALKQERQTVYAWITAGFAALFFLFVSIWTVSRVRSFSTPTFDFGIFSQMFYHMKESGLPMTTVERDGLLSHLHVHVSPVYYLLLPFYCLCPTPATLQVLQAAVLASSVIPLWKLGRHHGLSGLQRTLVCVVLLLYPAFSGGTSYDIHENCFLTPLVLWLFYGIERKSAAVIAPSAFLTLMVKEDAAVYVAVIALWLIVKTALRYRKCDLKNLLTGITLLAISLIWFLIVTGYLARIGDGVMTGRYRNFMYDGSSSLITVIKAVLLNPMKAVYEFVDPEKLRFIGLTLIPLLGLPLFTRRYERYILLIPYLLVNLMSDYQYQHDIFFQYTFGPFACLMYLTVVNLAELKINLMRLTVLVTATAVSAACFGAVIVPKAVRYPVQCIQYHHYYDSIRNVLEKIPEDASVTATTFYTTFLSQRSTLYDLRYSSREHLLSTQYVVIGVSAENDFKKFASGGKKNGFENLVKLLEENGYEQFAQLDGTLVIYKQSGCD